MLNKKIIEYALASVIFAGGVGLTTHGVTTKADNINYQQAVDQAKDDIKSQLDEEHSTELEEKENEIQELNNKINEQQNTINQLQAANPQAANPQADTSASTDDSAATKGYVNNKVDTTKQELQTGIDNNKKDIEEQKNKKDNNVLTEEQKKAMQPQEDHSSAKSGNAPSN